MLERRDVVIAGSSAGYDAREPAGYGPRVVHVEAGTNRIITIDAEAATLHVGAATEAERKH